MTFLQSWILFGKPSILVKRNWKTVYAVRRLSHPLFLDNHLLGLTKDIEFRKEQLKQLLSFMLEKKEVLIEALYADLHKHKVESNVGEIAGIVDECHYMIKVSLCDKSHVFYAYILFCSFTEHRTADQTC